MADSDDQNRDDIVVDLIHDPVIADANAVRVVHALYFFDPWPRGFVASPATAARIRS